MAINNKRPVFLNLFVIRLPVAGVSSILHRITGVLLVACLPFFLYALQHSLRDAEGFVQVMQRLQSLPGRLLLLVFIAIFAQHFATGIRHLFLSIGIGMGPVTAGRSAWLTFLFTVVVTLVAGMQLL